MKKAREIWVHRKNENVMGECIISDTKPLGADAIHFREVLDPDPKDEVIKILKEALDSISDPSCPYSTTERYWLSRDKQSCAEVLAYDVQLARKTLEAAEKLERE